MSTHDEDRNDGTDCTLEPTLKKKSVISNNTLSSVIVEYSNICVFHCERFFSYIKSIYKLCNWVIYETEILITESIMIKKKKKIGHGQTQFANTKHRTPRFHDTVYK